MVVVTVRKVVWRILTLDEPSLQLTAVIHTTGSQHNLQLKITSGVLAGTAWIQCPSLVCPWPPPRTQSAAWSDLCAWLRAPFGSRRCAPALSDPSVGKKNNRSAAWRCIQFRITLPLALLAPRPYLGINAVPSPAHPASHPFFLQPPTTLSSFISSRFSSSTPSSFLSHKLPLPSVARTHYPFPSDTIIAGITYIIMSAISVSECRSDLRDQVNDRHLKVSRSSSIRFLLITAPVLLLTLSPLFIISRSFHTPGVWLGFPLPAFPDTIPLLLLLSGHLFFTAVALLSYSSACQTGWHSTALPASSVLLSLLPPSCSLSTFLLTLLPWQRHLFRLVLLRVTRENTAPVLSSNVLLPEPRQPGLHPIRHEYQQFHGRRGRRCPGPPAVDGNQLPVDQPEHLRHRSPRRRVSQAVS